MKTSPATAVEDFLESLARLDFPAAATALRSDVHFRAIVPPGFREARGRQATIDMIRGWFEPATEARIVRQSSGKVGDRAHANYRIVVVDEGERLVAEESLIATFEDGKISTMDFLCSGFHPETEAS